MNQTSPHTGIPKTFQAIPVVIQSRESPGPIGLPVKLDEVFIEPGLAFCPSLQTTTVAEAMLRVLTIQAALTAKLNRDQPEKSPIFRRILELSS